MMAVELTLEPVLNCQTCWPLSMSSATTSPVPLPVNSRPPSVASMPAELGMSMSGVSDRKSTRLNSSHRT